MTTIFVAGGTGNIGREVILAIASDPSARLRVGARDPGKTRATFAELRTVEIAPFDYGDPETLKAALAGVDRVVLVSPLSPDMVSQTDALTNAARAAGARHFVRCSLLGADDPDPIEEAKWHRDADAIVRRSGIPFTILRPNQFFQNLLTPKNLASIRTESVLYSPLGDARLTQIDTRDIAAVIARVVLGGDTYLGTEHDVTGDQALSMGDVARILGEVLEKPVKYVAVDEAAARAGMLRGGLPEWLVSAILGWFAYCRTGKAAVRSSAVEQILGQRPRVFEDFVREHAAEMT